jgi:hypothetical protein
MSDRIESHLLAERTSQKETSWEDLSYLGRKKGPLQCKVHPNKSGTQTFAMTKANNTYIVGQ